MITFWWGSLQLSNQLFRKWPRLSQNISVAINWGESLTAEGFWLLFQDHQILLNQPWVPQERWSYTWHCFRPLQKIKDLPCRLPSRSRFPIWTMLRIIDNPQIQVYICVCVLLEYVHIRSCPNYIDYLFTMFPEFRIIYRCFSPISWSTPQKIHRESLTKIAVITRRTAKTMTLPSRGRSKLYIEISARIVDNWYTTLRQ